MSDGGIRRVFLTFIGLGVLSWTCGSRGSQGSKTGVGGTLGEGGGGGDARTSLSTLDMFCPTALSLITETSPFPRDDHKKLWGKSVTGRVKTKEIIVTYRDRALLNQI